MEDSLTARSSRWVIVSSSRASQHLKSSPSVGSVIVGGDSKTADAGTGAQVPMGNGQTVVYYAGASNL
jgi:hypothetical protein